METDGDHIHYMLDIPPELSVTKTVMLMKAFTTYWIWREFPSALRREFWKERTFWTDGYFACSIGNVSEAVLADYIANQG